MEIKKSKEADLERWRGLFFAAGLTVALALFCVALEWKTPVGDRAVENELLVPLIIEDEFGGEIISPVVHEKMVDESENAVYEDFNVTQTVSDTVEDLSATLSEMLEPPTSIRVKTPQREQALPELATESETTEEFDESIPHFPGGRVALVRFFYDNLKYPEAARKQKIQGRVWVSFVVEPDGNLTGIRVENGVYAFLDEEAERVVRLMPPWVPGGQNGKKERVKVYLPVLFHL
jgi:protein TonB